MKPALAVPYFTGIAAFIGNIVSLSASMQKWQETVVNKVLEELKPLLDRFKPQLLEVIEQILLQVREGIEFADTSPFAGIPGEKLRGIEDKLMMVYCSIETNDLKTFASAVGDMKKAVVADAQSAAQEASEIPDKLRDLKKAAKQKMESGLSGASSMFRALSEQEITSLLRSLWSSIRLPRHFNPPCSALLTNVYREELGLSVRNIIIVLLSSSIILGLFILFIFIGIGIFSDGENPFAAVVNAGLTLSAGLGDVRLTLFSLRVCVCLLFPDCYRLPQRVASAYILLIGTGVNANNQTDEAKQGNAVFDAIVSKFLLILESRLKKTKSIVLQILVAMTSTEAESAQIIATLQEMKLGIDNVCSTVSITLNESAAEKAKKSDENAARTGVSLAQA